MDTEYLSDVFIKNNKTINDVEIRTKFRTTQKEIDKLQKDNLIFITTNLDLRRYLTDEEKNKKKSITDLLLEWGQNQDGTDETKELFNITNERISLIILNLAY